MRWGRIQMLGIAGLGAAITIATFVYIVVSPPAYLHQTRDGVPYFTPPVVDPATGKPLDVDMLVRHYKGDHGAPSLGAD